MKIRIGIQHSNLEQELEVNMTPEELSSKVAHAISSGTVLELTDAKGNALLIPGAHLAFVRVISDDKPRVGFLG